MSKRRGNGEGSIYQRKDGRWVATLSLPAGRRKSIYGKTRQDVARKLPAAQKAVQDGLPLPSENQRFGSFLTSWLESVKPSLRPETWRRYESQIRRHAVPELGKVRLARLTPQHLQKLYASRLEAGLHPSSVVHLHAVIHRALEQAVRYGLVARNVASLVDRPRIPRRDMATLSTDQAKKLLRAVRGDRFEALYVLALTTGMRRGELLALRWDHIDLDRGALQVRGTLQRTREGLLIGQPKTDSSRRQVALTRTAVAALRRHRSRQRKERVRLGSEWRDSSLVFATKLGGLIEPGNLLRRSYWPLLERAGLPRARFHDLRHSAATLMLGEGVHPKVVSEMLGHSKVAITLDVYSHVVPTMQQQAVKALDDILAVGSRP